MATDELFPGFAARHIVTPAGEIFARVGGSGPPLLLLHGYPETHAMWHRVAPALAQQYTVVAADLRGYGRSFVAPTVAGHLSYSKRAMAADMTAVMSALGFERFAIMGHDRGARVTYRLLLDDPGRVTRAVLLDIMSTADFWERLDRRHALRMYHWMFLAQAAPLPERLIDGDPRGYLEGRFKRGMATRPDWLDHHVFEDYRRAFDDPARRHATCEDYRAGSTCDVEHDLADRSAGRRITVPVRLLWGTRGNLADAADPLALWRPWCPSITGRAIDCGHFIPEEAPDALLADVMGWLAA